MHLITRIGFIPYLIPLLVLLSTRGHAQVIVVAQSFESSASDNWNYVTDPPPYSEASGSDVWKERASVGSDAERIATAAHGRRFFAIRDLNNAGSGGDFDHRIDFAEIDIQNFRDVTISLDHRLVGFDDGDYIHVIPVVDGVATPPTSLANSANYERLTLSVPDGAQRLALTVIARQDGGTDWAALDRFRIMGTEIVASCDLNIDIEDLRFFCEAFTGGSDPVSASLRYYGMEPGVSIQLSNANLSTDSDDPASEEGGTHGAARSLRFDGLYEGSLLQFSVSGGGCTGEEAFNFSVPVPSDLCRGSKLTINEINASTSADHPSEFIELYNEGETTIDLSGFTVEETAGRRYTFPTGTQLPPGGMLTLYDGQPGSAMDCDVYEAPFLGLNDGADVVIVRAADGGIVAQHSYTGGPSGQSIARAEDGSYGPHSAVSPDGSSASPCAANSAAAGLPVVLSGFTARAFEKYVRIEWRTESEQASAEFGLQRSTDGKLFEEIFRVPSDGGPYHYRDRTSPSGQLYYRLRQTDEDGTTTYFPTIAVVNGRRGWKLYPNPTGGFLRLLGPVEEADHLELLGEDGRLLHQLQLDHGRLSVHGLRAGTYWLRIVSAREVTTLPFIKTD